MSVATTMIRKASDGGNSKSRRRPTWRVLRGAALIHAVLSSSVQARDDRWGWSYCPPPYPPACVEATAKTSDISPRDRLACEQSVERYVASVFAYRVCLSGETERAVREANHVLQIMKCPRDERYCYDLPQPDAPPVRKPAGR